MYNLYLRILVLSLLTLSLYACAGMFRSQVVSFHEGPLPQGETIRVEPMGDATQGSQEFKHYARLIEDKLREIGYRPVAENEQAMLVAKVDYSISDGMAQTRRDTRGYVRYHFYVGRYARPFYYGFYDNWEPDVYTYMTYDRTLRMNIEAADTGELIFEGRVQSTGREAELAQIMPYMISAMFSNFPGESGVTKVVSIEKDQ